MEGGEHCHCPEPGCMFAGSPPALSDHLAGDHAWPVFPVTYGKVLMLEMQAAERQRLLATEDGEDVFLLIARETGGGQRDFKVVCVRAGADDGPWWYRSTVWTHGAMDTDDDILMMDARMRSCAMPSEEAAMQVSGMYLRVPSDMATAAGGLDLRVRIDKEMKLEAVV